MKLYQSFESIVNLLIRPLDLRLQRISRINSLEAGRDLARLSENAKIIGSIGAAEAFIQYASHETSKEEYKLIEFMQFYANHFKASRSQWSQDIYVMYATGLLKNGRYLEVGGADGITHSNTLALHNELGWSGVLIEPDPSMFRLLSASRGHSDRAINAAVSPKGEQGYAQLRRAGQLSSLVGHEGADMHEHERNNHNEVVNVNTLNITSIMASLPRLDYFSLDVEGAEPAIIESIDWKLIDPPSVITVEHNYRIADKNRLKKLLEAQGYIEEFASYEWLRRGDLWMKHKDFVISKA